jgi:CheY-like chemotaxis protein
MINSELLLKKLSILLVEDDPIARRVCSLFLQDLHYQVDTVDCGQQALAVFKANYDIIFLDIGLPDINGYEVAKRIRAYEEEYQRKPVHIVAITAHIYDSDKAECFAAGINDFISKPISKDSLHRVLMDFAINR